MKKILLLTMFLPMLLIAQPSDPGNWLIYFGNKKINDRWNWHHEIQYRNFNFIGDTEQVLLRTGIGYNLTENNNNILLGYGFIYSEPYIVGTNDKTQLNEHRVFQQYITRQLFGRLSMQHRYRFEQRFIEDNFKFRIRYFLALNIAINNKMIMDKTFYISTYNEFFANTDQVIFDRNRLYGGLGYRFSENMRAEIGLMNQTTNAVSRNQVNLITFVNF